LNQNLKSEPHKSQRSTSQYCNSHVAGWNIAVPYGLEFSDSYSICYELNQCLVTDNSGLLHWCELFTEWGRVTSTIRNQTYHFDFSGKDITLPLRSKAAPWHNHKGVCVYSVATKLGVPTKRVSSQNKNLTRTNLAKRTLITEVVKVRPKLLDVSLLLGKM